MPQEFQIILSGGVDYYGDGGEADENTLKDLSKWPVSDYFNIWIVSKLKTIMEVQEFRAMPIFLLDQTYMKVL